MLLGLDAGGARGFLAEPQKAADLVTQLGKSGVIDSFILRAHWREIYPIATLKYTLILAGLRPTVGPRLACYNRGFPAISVGGWCLPGERLDRTIYAAGDGPYLE